MYKVVFSEIKRLVSMDMVLGRYGIETRKVNGVQLRANCPLPSHTGKSERTFCVNVDANVWCCKSDTCQGDRRKNGGDVIEFVARMESCTLREAGEKIAEWFAIADVAADHLTSAPKPKPEVKPEPKAEETGENPPLSWCLQGISSDHPYLLEERKFSKEVLDAFGVGFFPGKGIMAGRVVFPLRDRFGALTGYAGRAVGEVAHGDRWRFPSGFRRNQCLWGFHRASASDLELVVVVESFWGALRLWEAGYRAVALLGKTVSDYQVELISHFKCAVLMLDGDQPGKEAVPAALGKIAQKAFVRVIQVEGQPDHYSPSDLAEKIGLIA
jgi:DNA primase